MVRLLLLPSVALLCLLAPLASGADAPATDPARPEAAQLPLAPEDIVTHVSHTIAWYRGIVALQQLAVDSDDVVPRDRLYEAARLSARLAFEFGHAASRLAAKPGNQGGATRAPDDSQNATPIDRAAARIADRVSNLQSQLTAVEAEIGHARAGTKETLVARRGEIAAALDLAKEIQGTVSQIQRFEATSDAEIGGASGGLAARISDLRRSVPELREDIGEGEGSRLTAASQSAAATQSPGASPRAGTAAPAPSANSQAVFRPESAGMIALLGKWFALEGARRQLADAAKQTDGLAKEIDGIRDRITQQVRELARQDLDSSAADAEQLAQSRANFELAATRFRDLATLVVPVGEQAVATASARNMLEQWREALAARTVSVARFLALRLGFLVGSVAVVLIVSDVWRRATFRYLHDARRRQQFLALRRVAVGVALAVVIVFGLVSEVGSLATYAGLITAGLAVALQNVILAVVAYFFLIGRYGVRVGDRITLAGVTGRVVEIGLVRIYLMELTGPQLRSTGRMVVLSNAVLFQPTALFKQMPGGEFYWHTATMTLAASTDIELAEKRLSEAAESVYEKYRPAIEQQHAALQRLIDFQTALPQPEVYARLSAKGLECTVRYPVEPEQAAATDQRMLVAIRAAQSRAPALELVEGPLFNTSEGS